MTVIDKIRERLDDFAHLPAVIDGDESWTHAQLHDRVNRLSNALIDLGLRKGDVLLAWLPNCHQAIEIELACFQVGGIWVTLNAGLTWPEVSAVVQSTHPKVIVTNPSLHDRIQPDANETKFLDEATFVLTERDMQHISFESLIENASPEIPDVSVSEDDIARLRYTSGTTGHVKAAVLPHSCYLASLENLQNELHALDTSDRVLHAAPLTHASAALMYPILCAGGVNVVLPRFDVDDVLETIERERITTMFTVPTILQRLTMSPAFQKRDLSSLRTVTYGGAPIAVEKLVPAIERLGTVLLQIYGLTEALHPVTTLKRDEHWVGNPKLGTIGKPTAICEVRLLDDEGMDVPQGEVGEIFVRGPIVMDRYWNDPEETASVFRGEWLASGDLASQDDDGYYKIVDRKKDVIISGGFNVYSKEVEQVLCQHPDIIEAAVLGIADPEWGEKVHAVVVPHESSDLTETQLIAHCRAYLAGYKTPKSIAFRTDPLPKNGAGKIRKRELMSENKCR